MRKLTPVQAKQLIANGKKKVIKKKNNYYTIAEDKPNKHIDYNK